MKHASSWLAALMALALSPYASTAWAQDGTAEEETPAEGDAPVEGAPVEGAPVEDALAPVEGTDPAAQDGQAEDAPTGTTPAETAAIEAPPESPETLTPPSATAATRPEADEDEEVAEAEADEPAPLPWRNSLFMWDHSLNTTALDPSSTITHDPTYTWTFTVLPRWYLTDSIFLRVRQDLTYELTDSDFTSYNRQPMLADTQLDLVDASALSAGDFRLQAGARLIAPTSIASRANDVYFGTGAFAVGMYSFPEVLDGLMLIANGSYSHFWSGSNVTGTAEPYPCYVNDVGAAQVCSQVGGPSTVSDSIVAGLTGSLNVTPELNVSAGFTWLWRVANGLADAEVPVLGAPGGSITLADASETHIRGLTYFSASAAYQMNPWFNLSANFYTFTTQLSPDGSRRNPFWNVDSSVSLTATVTLDTLYTDISGGGSGGGNTNTLRQSAQNGRGRQVAANRTTSAAW